MSSLPMRRWVIAGPHSGAGKTSVTLGLLAALRRRGIAVAPFKVGPDYIDPAHHTAAAGRPSHNLDGWMLPEEANRELFELEAQGSEVAVIEGVMGLFDGYDGATERGSTAQMAKWIGAEVLFVVDCFAMARSAAALISGFVHFDPEVKFGGVILNRVAGERHFEWLKEAIEPALDLPILGGLANSKEIALPERHLGLVQAGELIHPERFEALADWVEAGLDLDALLGGPRPQVVGDASEGEGEVEDSAFHGTERVELRARPAMRIGIARDVAFSFYYEANLALLAQLGADCVEFSPLADEVPDDLEGVILGGGYPELFAGQLSKAVRVKALLARLHRNGAPILGECGGLMFLGESLRVDGVAHGMAGLLPLETEFSEQLTLGYCEVRALTDNPLSVGGPARGHRFHRSRVLAGPPPNAWIDGDGIRHGYAQGNLLASYVHLHFFSNRELPARFISLRS